MSPRRIAVYCASSETIPDLYRQAAYEFGRLMASAGVGLVYGGGRVGLMGEVAAGALEAGGEVIGVITYNLQRREVGHGALSELIKVKTMRERKMMMAALAEGFVALPGGFGTWDELIEVATLAIVGEHAFPMGLLNTEGYWDPFLAFIRHSERLGFTRPMHASMLRVEPDPARLLARMQAPGEDMASWLEEAGL
ncbi:TIGR00730 family Rossman fold protein [Myxococcota bacterium]|nr:TIGR00730 family Rossman fold protein [Myxococcota bacterium]MBU1433246.1 TIGR00730 family Rossman fold protein [Myxococcota bacterium]MBU1896898.1 TIGR00730 family Rossman fold protein [Myxococcota bacterium]